MVNTEFKFQAKTPNSSKVHIHKESQKQFKFRSQFDLEVQSESHQFSNTSETFQDTVQVGR